MEQENFNPFERDNALTLPEGLSDSRDFSAEEAIDVDFKKKIPEFFSLGKWVYSTSNQGNVLGSCTSNSTCHGIQVLAVAKGKVIPTENNIITPDFLDLWAKMGHSITEYDGGDYVEKAINRALKHSVATEEGGTVNFDGYATMNFEPTNECLHKMKCYLANGNPIVWTCRGNADIYAQMSKGRLERGCPYSETIGGHAICFVGYDNNGFRVLNSRRKNDDKKLKSRFYVTNEFLLENRTLLNYRMRMLYNKADAKVDVDYLKRKGNVKLVLEALKKIYEKESDTMKDAIVEFSKTARASYPELNEELPV